MVSFGLLFLTLLTAYGQLFSPSFALPLIGHFVLVRVGHRAHRVGLAGGHPRADGHPPAAAPAHPGAPQPVLRVDVLAGLLRRADHPRRRPLHPDPARSRVRPRPGHRRGARHGAALPADVLDRQRVRRAVGRRPRGRHRRRRGAEDPHLDGLADHHLAAADDGRRLAPVPRLLQHLLQAARRRPHLPGRAAADRGRRQPGRLREHRGPRRGRRARRRQGRGLHLEGPARLHHLHRVRPLPVPVPGLEHREAAVAQAARDGAARPRARQGAVPAGGRGRPRRPAGGDPGAGRACRWSATRATTSETRSGPTTRTGPTRSSTRTCCGRARRAAPASSSAPSTSSTSTPSSTCAATRC